MSSGRFALLALCSGAICAPVYGQSGEDLDNIIVTGSRTPIQEVNLGSSTTVITRDQIESRQARYVTDMLRSVPGFAISHSGTTGSQTQVRVRGSEANHVLVLIDGVRANDPASGDEFRWELLSTSNIERIEIVRGPQSSLWGSDAVAAVVHVITNSGSGDTGLGGYAEGGSNETINAGFNGAVAGQAWSVGYALESLATDGTNISRVGNEMDDSDMLTASISGKVDATERVSFTFGARAIDAYAQFDPIDFVDSGLPADGDLATESSQAYAHLGGALVSPGGFVTHRLNARYFESSNDNLTDGVANSSTASDRTTFAYQADIRISNDTLSVALENEQTRFEQRGEVGFGDPNQDQENSTTSLIADYQGHLSERFTWLLSARYDDNSDFEDATTGRLAVAWHAGASSTVRGSIGTGQKTPTFIERYGFFPGQFVGNPDLKPETSTSIEVGLDQVFPNANLDLQLTVFHQNLQDEINGFVFDPDTFLFTAENLAGDSTRTGAEIAGSWRPVESLLLSASYTYTDAVEENDQGDETRELRRPRHMGSLGGEYRFFDERGNLTLVADYGGSRTDQFFPPFPEPSEIVTLDAAWLVDMTLGFDVTRSINLFARVTNLLDEEYEQVYGYATRGRAAYVGARLQFGM